MSRCSEGQLLPKGPGAEHGDIARGQASNVEQGRSRVRAQGQPRARTTSQVHGELRPGQAIRLQVGPGAAGPVARHGRTVTELQGSILWHHWGSG